MFGMNGIYNAKSKLYLQDAQRLVDKPGGWTQHARARDDHYRPVPPNWSSATRFCVLGAVDRAVGGIAVNYVMFVRCMFILGERLPADWQPKGEAASRLASWNDRNDTSHDDVRRLFAAAIADCAEVN